MIRTRRAAAAAVLVLAAGLARAATADPGAGDLAEALDWSTALRITPEERERLERGETVTRSLAMAGENQRAGVAARYVERPPDRVFRVVADLDHWPEWVPYLDGSERAGGGGPPARDLQFDLPWPLRDRHYRATVRTELSGPRRASPAPADGGVARGTSAAESPGARERAVVWASVPDTGNVEWARGSFVVVDDRPDRSLVVFRSATDLGPPRFGRALLDRTMEESLRWVLDALAQQVERCRYTVPFPDGCAEARPGRP